MKKYLYVIGVIVFFLLAGLVLSAAFIVTEIDQAVITQWGRPVRVIVGDSPFNQIDLLQENIVKLNGENDWNVRVVQGAGLYFKLPYFQKVEYFDDRALEYDAQPEAIVTKDKKNLVVDNFARWYIYDPLLFRQSIISIANARTRLDDIIYSALRDVLGKNDFIEIIRSNNDMVNDLDLDIPAQKRIQITTGRDQIMKEVTEISRREALSLGVYIIDVRIKRADVPTENQSAIYENMKAERARISMKYEEEGKRDAAIIRAETDLTVNNMLAEAEREAQVIQGTADAEAARIYANGFVKEVSGQASQTIQGFEDNPEFFRFVRSLEALEKSLDSNTTLILDTQNELLRSLNQTIK
ncbi:MAG: protease modulator HflC [Candidatus Hinthialibacter antarcticus]|nr:protease modulator HflC [Candidatus Hinthialibacter antarcticus]